MTKRRYGPRGIVYEAHGCCPPPGGNHAGGTLWRCPSCGLAWYRNDNHPLNSHPLWSPVMPWHFRRRRKIRARQRLLHLTPEEDPM
jgi:hypothetical protein